MKGILACSKLFDHDFSRKISNLNTRIFKHYIHGNMNQDNSLLKIALHRALNIKTELSHVSPWSSLPLSLYESEYTYFYIVEPDALNELMLQKLQDNPALYTDCDGNKVVPARIVKLQENWYNEWLIAEVMAQIKFAFSVERHDRVQIHRHLNVKAGNELIRTAQKRIKPMQYVYNSVSNKKVLNFDTLLVDAIALQIKHNMVAK